MAIKLIKKNEGASANEARSVSYGGNRMGIRLIKKNEKADGFSHVWELQAQQAKETLNEITKKFGDSNRLDFDIRKYSRRPECDVYVTVDGAPFISVEFEGGKTGNIHWHCFNDEVDSARLDMADENAARNLILHYREDILDALESLYGLGAIADEGGQAPESKKVESTARQEASSGDKWCVEFCDIYSNIQKEYYATEADAKERYDELAERGDIEWVEKPVLKAESKAEKLGYDDYAESVKTILMGREFEYGPETASQFVADDYKDIVRKNYDAGKGALAAAADIDAAYMGEG